MSAVFRCGQHHRKIPKGSYSFTDHYFNNEPDFSFGSLVILPLIPELDDRDAVNLLLEDILGLPQATLPPLWAEQLTVPGLNEVEAAIHERKQDIALATSEIENFQAQKRDLENYRKLVYATGVELEKMFAKALIELGAKVSPAKYSQEEYILEWEGQEYLVEVKGVTKSVSLDHIRQLMDYLLKFQKDTDKQCKGILFGNAWRSLGPSQRDSEQTPVFPSNVLRFAESHNIALVSSIDFFESLCAALAGNVPRKDIVD
ncbi:MAG: hypothetical protein ACREBC_31200, partial [Pyrinomonadaceae bacterium]